MIFVLLRNLFMSCFAYIPLESAYAKTAVCDRREVGQSSDRQIYSRTDKRSSVLLYVRRDRKDYWGSDTDR